MQERVDHRLDQPAAAAEPLSRCRRCCCVDGSGCPHSAPQCSAVVGPSLKKYSVKGEKGEKEKARYVKDLVRESDALLRYLIGKTKNVLERILNFMSTFFPPHSAGYLNQGTDANIEFPLQNKYFLLKC